MIENNELSRLVKEKNIFRKNINKLFLNERIKPKVKIVQKKEYSKTDIEYFTDFILINEELSNYFKKIQNNIFEKSENKVKINILCNSFIYKIAENVLGIGEIENRYDIFIFKVKFLMILKENTEYNSLTEIKSIHSSNNIKEYLEIQRHSKFGFDKECQKLYDLKETQEIGFLLNMENYFKKNFPKGKRNVPFKFSFRDVKREAYASTMMSSEFNYSLSNNRYSYFGNFNANIQRNESISSNNNFEMENNSQKKNEINNRNNNSESVKVDPENNSNSSQIIDGGGKIIQNEKSINFSEINNNKFNSTFKKNNYIDDKFDKRKSNPKNYKSINLRYSFSIVRSTMDNIIYNRDNENNENNQNKKIKTDRTKINISINSEDNKTEINEAKNKNKDKKEGKEQIINESNNLKDNPNSNSNNKQLNNQEDLKNNENSSHKQLNNQEDVKGNDCQNNNENITNEDEYEKKYNNICQYFDGQLENKKDYYKDEYEKQNKVQENKLKLVKDENERIEKIIKKHNLYDRVNQKKNDNDESFKQYINHLKKK